MSNGVIIEEPIIYHKQSISILEPDYSIGVERGLIEAFVMGEQIVTFGPPYLYRSSDRRYHYFNRNTWGRRCNWMHRRFLLVRYLERRPATVSGYKSRKT